jgi:hypothetical protein
MNARIAFAGLLVASGALLVAGCTPAGPAKHDVTGRVTNKGEPMKVREVNGQKVGRLRVWLAKADAPPPVEEHDAVVEPDGSFSIKGPLGVPAGKYKVCVTWQDDYPTGADKLGGKFNQQNTKVVREIPSKEPINIDVSRPEG